MFIDTLIVSDQIFPDLPKDALDFLDETEDSLWHQFFYMFTFVCTLDDVWQQFQDIVDEFDWAASERPGQTYHEQDVVHDLFVTYTVFHRNAEKPLHFLRNPPPGIVISNIEVTKPYPDAFVLKLTFDQSSTDPQVLSQPQTPLPWCDETNHVYNQQPIYYPPHSNLV